MQDQLCVFQLAGWQTLTLIAFRQRRELLEIPRAVGITGRLDLRLQQTQIQDDQFLTIDERFAVQMNDRVREIDQ